MRLLSIFPLLVAGTLATVVPPYKEACGHITNSENKYETIYATLGECTAFEHGATSAFVHTGAKCYFFKSLPDVICAADSLMATVDGTNKDTPLPGEAASYFCLISPSANAIEEREEDGAAPCWDQVETCDMDQRTLKICHYGHWQRIVCRNGCDSKQYRAWCT
ncbi:hypothetical protein K491DRAFT_679718 [Lophiostoma macrostomum CBS 122681]|uniref:Carbohydrate-binding module family 19 domain-containing protein n=1 Tax=Lophiostoma macrostomum CBS 122681 TaxID=1314788 RepID=A0A6A6T725_9PLEO|nr:hypothetical protein K491DRAFT_679718 [Lophiostoma macrostomum CBS 122681]